MPLEAPHWLFLGIAYAAGAATLATAAFALGEFAFPTPTPWASGRVSGADRRRVEIRHYLDTIGEHVVEDASVRGVRCEFYLPARDVAVTLESDTYNRLRTTATYVVFCEHEMRGAQLGARLPFETPETGRSGRRRTRAGTRTGSSGRRRAYGPGGVGAGARAAADRRRREDAIASAYRTLGLPRDATVAEVKAAYREKVKDVHPDRGGSEDAFTRVQEAYTTARRHAT